MGNVASSDIKNGNNNKRINFEDVQQAIKNNDIIINTLTDDKQSCLIANTVNIKDEVNLINDLINNNRDIFIIIYGENTMDDSVIKKQEQLNHLGFTNVYIYMGGLFEWLLLQDIYGSVEFETTIIEKDLLKYKGAPMLMQKQLKLY